MDSDLSDFDTDDGEIEDELIQDSVNDDAPSSSSDDDLRGLVGLQNLGNTCYMNGALQALSNCQQLTRFVLDCPGFLKESGLCRSYSELIREIWSSKNSQYAVPTSIIRNIKCIYPAFRGCTQQDTQEFLRCFLEQLHDELKQPVIKSNNIPDPTSTTTIKQSSSSSSSSRNTLSTSLSDNDLIGYKKTALGESIQETCKSNSCMESHRSIISDTFEFKISSSVVCSNCNNISTTEETFKDLSIPIPSRDHPYYQDNHEDSCGSISSSSAISDIDSPGPSSLIKVSAEGGPKLTNIGEQPLSSQKNHIEMNSANTETPVHQDECKDVQKLHLIDSIPLARWFLNWFGRLGSWFWGPQITLNDCLSIFFGTDPLEGDNEYSCEVCTKKNKGVKFLKILELPEVLCIHFKRYESVGSAKITTHVSFPLTGLDLAPFMSDNCKPQCTTYNLIACICHHGSALLTGHYTTYALNCYDDQWYEFDDQYVNCVSSFQVENSEAYILFYQKSFLDDTTDRQRVKASKLLKKSLRTKNINKYFISKQWVNKFNTFVEPGPITNHDFLCKHEKVPKKKQPDVGKLCHPISENVWNYLLKLHGGGPPCHELIPCETCG